VSLDDFLDNGKPKPGALTRRAIDAIKTLEDAVTRQLWNARAGILDTEERYIGRPTRSDGDRAAHGRLPQGVVDEVVEQLAQQYRVSKRLRGVEGEPQVDVALHRARYPFLDRRVGDSLQVDGLQRL
jgi:hypothetical protein